MDFSELNKEIRKGAFRQYGINSLSDLMRFISPDSRPFTDSPGEYNAMSNQWQEKFHTINRPDQPDTNEMYQELNDLYQRNPQDVPEVNRRLLDNGLNDNLFQGVLQKYTTKQM